MKKLFFLLALTFMGLLIPLSGQVIDSVAYPNSLRTSNFYGTINSNMGELFYSYSGRIASFVKDDGILVSTSSIPSAAANNLYYVIPSQFTVDSDTLFESILIYSVSGRYYLCIYDNDETLLWKGEVPNAEPNYEKVFQIITTTDPIKMLVYTTNNTSYIYTLGGIPVTTTTTSTITTYDSVTVFKNINVYKTYNVSVENELTIYSGEFTGVYETNTEVLSVYPNPATSSINIKTTGTGTYGLNIVNVDGNSVYFDNNIEGSAETQIDISKFPVGTYILQFKEGSSNIVSKQLIIKE